MSVRKWTAMVLFVGLSLVPAAFAESEDPPGVARVALIEGHASYHLRDGKDWVGVAVNAPLVTGDRFYAGVGSRAEIQVAGGTYLRLGPETQIELLELAVDATQVRIPMGQMILRLREDPRRRHVEINVPGAAFVIKKAGRYRVDVNPDGRTTIRIGRGEAVAHVAEERLELFAATSTVIDASGLPIRILPERYGEDDQFDLWEAGRDQRVEDAVSYRHVSTEIYGAEDLDDHGEWVYRSEYGQIWRPTTVSDGWAPYRDGRWVWTEPWGWTWLDYAAWGWAPFHYGRWVRLYGTWYWAPGRVVARPIYAPALVAFYGVGALGAVSVGFGGGYVGWVPLGWGEPCLPWWGGFGGIRIGSPWWGGWGGPRIVNNVVISQRNVYNLRPKDIRWANRHRRGGFTVVPRDGFGRGGRAVTARGRPWRSMRPTGSGVGVKPVRASRRAVHPSRAIVEEAARPRRTRSPRRLVGGSVPANSAGSRRSALDRSKRPGASSSVATPLPGRSQRTAVQRAAPRPPSRAPTVVGSTAAPREFARRREPYVASRPRFEPGTASEASPTFRGLRSRSDRPSVSRRGAAASSAPSWSRSRSSSGRSSTGTSGPSWSSRSRVESREKRPVQRFSARSPGGSKAPQTSVAKSRGPSERRPSARRLESSRSGSGKSERSWGRSKVKSSSRSSESQAGRSRPTFSERKKPRTSNSSFGMRSSRNGISSSGRGSAGSRSLGGRRGSSAGQNGGGASRGRFGQR